MRFTLALTLLAVAAAPAAADTFGGFSAVDKPYLVNSDRVCAPLVVANAAATGVPKCEKVAADVLAKLDVKPPIVQSGAKATFAATVSSRTLTVTRKDDGGIVTTWDAPDPIAKVIDVYASELGDRVAVAYTTRRAGRDFTDVVAFDLIHVARPTTTGTTPTPTAPQPVDAPEDPSVTKAVGDARKATGAKALPAWQAVLVIDATHSESLYRVAALQVAAKKTEDALASLEALAKSPHADAVEWRVEARFDKAFASLLREPRFRAAVGLDGKGATPYERFMGFGGQWEQTGTSCDKATVKLVALRDRTFKLRVKTTCEGQVFDLPFHGIWSVTGADGITLAFPPSAGKQPTDVDESVCKLTTSGDEDSLHCSLGHDLDFSLLPTRR